MFPTAAGTRSELESRIRGLVADHLGVGAHELRREVSLVEDLAADSLDLVEIALALEGNLGVVLPREFLDEVRTCGDLIDATVALAHERRKTLPGAQADARVPLRARITPAGTSRGWVVERVLLLTPYAAETLADDAQRAGSGARLELIVAPQASEGALTWVGQQFARLRERGIEVDIRRDPATGRPRRFDAA
jgi:acyl carrier protein